MYNHGFDTEHSQLPPEGEVITSPHSQRGKHIERLSDSFKVTPRVSSRAGPSTQQASRRDRVLVTPTPHSSTALQDSKDQSRAWERKAIPPLCVSFSTGTASVHHRPATAFLGSTCPGSQSGRNQSRTPFLPGPTVATPLLFQVTVVSAQRPPLLGQSRLFISLSHLRTLLPCSISLHGICMIYFISPLFCLPH